MKPAVDGMDGPEGRIFEGEIGDENVMRVHELYKVASCMI